MTTAARTSSSAPLPTIDIHPASASCAASAAEGKGDTVTELPPLDAFAPRHIGPDDKDIARMLAKVGYADLEQFTDAVVPPTIRLAREMRLEGLPESGLGESAALDRLRSIVSKNKVCRNFIGCGYYGTQTPGVILRNVFENPGWYTQYTPYQAEIAQGRLEALLNFQTMVSDLTGLPLAGASLLDEATAAGEAMAMCFAIAEQNKKTFLIASSCHPQTVGVVRTRAEALGITLKESDPAGFEFTPDVCGVLVQYPDTNGQITDFRPLIEKAHAAGAMVVMATDLLALTLLTPPGELGADIAIGSAQRFGVPMGLGGPHAAFISTKQEHVRRLPGRIIGVSRDAQGNPALRMAIQTREQHIRREKATSNICTAQALLAIIAGLYAAYHGPEGLVRMARRVHGLTSLLARRLAAQGDSLLVSSYFDTLRVKPSRGAAEVLAAAEREGINLRDFGDGTIGVSLDETAGAADVADILSAFAGKRCTLDGENLRPDDLSVERALARTSAYMTHPVFRTHHSEHEMLRYIFSLMGKDLSLTHSMIPLGSCTMKLNATSEMIPVTWRAVGQMHPFAPRAQWAGYEQVFRDLETWLSEITGFAAVSLQPNSGAAGEYAGLMVIREYFRARGESHRNVCLIPESAHGTNPASAVCAGFEVVGVKNTPAGDIDFDDLRSKAAEHKDNLAALMVTYPSTYGVFEERIADICRVIHEHGGQVYMDGANMNAQVGLTSPGRIGADVCHLNLHKTFCIPHGGGGPGMGPIGVAAHLAPYLPGHPVRFPETLRQQNAGAKAMGPVSAAPYGSASILVISWMYIAMMGASGLRRASQVAMLSANYMAARMEGHYGVLFKGRNGRCAHEFIIDVRPFDKSAASSRTTSPSG